MNLYVRLRGKVHGPFDETRLKAMVNRGQLSRIHQVSEDGNSWTKASAYDELFAAAEGLEAEPIDDAVVLAAAFPAVCFSSVCCFRCCPSWLR